MRKIKEADIECNTLSKPHDLFILPYIYYYIQLCISCFSIVFFLHLHLRYNKCENMQMGLG